MIQEGLNDEEIRGEGFDKKELVKYEIRVNKITVSYVDLESF